MVYYLNFFSGKLQALSGVTKDQRREYKSKFVDMDIEFQRMKERLETIHLILDDMQVCNFLLTVQYCGIYNMVNIVFVKKSIYIRENEIVWNVVSMSAKCITSILR